MNRILFVVLICTLALAAFGCAKKDTGAGDKDARDIPQIDPNVKTGSPSSSKTELAQGELKELLLALKNVHFGLDSSELAPEVRSELESAASKLSDHPEVQLWVDGHTDERGTTEYNMSLGERRARTVVEYMTRMGVPPERLGVVSHGEEQPIDSASTEVSYARNRRVDFQLMKGEIQLVLEEGTLLDDEGNPISKDKEETKPETAKEPEKKDTEESKTAS